MKKEIIILGDVEMGAGTLTDDFISDKTLFKLISELNKRKHPVDLIFNGDTFDFLKCPYIKAKKKSFPRHITEEISLTKLDLIKEAHKIIFDVLQKFVRQKKNRLFFTIGNHDHDLFFKKIQTKIKRILKSRGNVYIRNQYKYHGVYAEHGQQLDFLNRVNVRRIFVTYKGEQILNIPWVAFSLISKFMDIKEEHPFLERIVPYPLLFAHHKVLLKKMNWRSAEYLFKSLLYYPFRYFYDPTYYTIPRELLREIYRRFKSVNWGVDDIVEKFKSKRRWQKRLQQKVHVLSHVHKQYIEEKDDWVIIHPDTWRDEYILNVDTGKLTPKKKKYVQIILEDDDSLQWTVVDVPIKRSVLDFDEVSKDEIKFIKKAAKEEWFKGGKY